METSLCFSVCPELVKLLSEQIPTDGSLEMMNTVGVMALSLILKGAATLKLLICRKKMNQ